MIRNGDLMPHPDILFNVIRKKRVGWLKEWERVYLILCT
jgi:hypothetical protein